MFWLGVGLFLVVLGGVIGGYTYAENEANKLAAELRAYEENTITEDDIP